MENYFTLIFGIVVSCMVYSITLFQFIEERYNRVYASKLLYAVIQVGAGTSIVLINLLNMPVLNLLSMLAIFGFVEVLFYYDNEKKTIQRVFEIEVLILVLMACELVGYLMLDQILWRMKIDRLQPIMIECMKITFSKLIILIIYYSVITKIWGVAHKSRFTPAQYMVHIIIMIYSLVNFSVIIFVVTNGMTVSFTEKILLLVNMFCIVFADLYLLYFTRFVEENGQLKMKLRLLEQQSHLQYDNYASQEEKYNESIKILHDVNKHLNMIEQIYEYDRGNEAKQYAKEIGKLLQPLAIQQFTNNPILNILLNEKKKYALLHNISFDMQIGNVEVKFMEPMEITTVFGNLLDNAIEACNTLLGQRYISLKLDTFNDFMAIHISNSSSGQIKWHGKKPVSNKGRNHGIGLINVENVINKYNGNMILEEKNGVFSCDIICNH